MVTLKFETKINAILEEVFNMARSVDVHLETAAHTQEKAVRGKTSGLLELGDTITWEARHLGVRQQLTAEIVALEKYSYFEDRMIRGAFASLRHVHTFEAIPSGTLMKDMIEFEAPWGILGRIAEVVFLKRHMTHFLKTKNAVFKVLAEQVVNRERFDLEESAGASILKEMQTRYTSGSGVSDEGMRTLEANELEKRINPRMSTNRWAD